MATANTKSNIVTNADATPVTLTAVNLKGGRLREQVATVEIAAADDDGSTYRLFRVHTSDRVSSIEIFNDAISGGTDFNIGAYDVADAGGAIIDGGNSWGDAVTMASARTTPTDVCYEINDVANIEQEVWEVLALTSDPNKFVDIVLTAVTVGTVAGTISARLRYVSRT